MHLCVCCVHLLKDLAAKIPFHSIDARQPLFASEDNSPVPRKLSLMRIGLGWGGSNLFANGFKQLYNSTDTSAAAELLDNKS